MEQNQVCVLFWVKFTFNYPDIKEVIKWICEKTDKNKEDLRDALTEYALTVWAPVGMCHTYEEVKTLLGI